MNLNEELYSTVSLMLRNSMGLILFDLDILLIGIIWGACNGIPKGVRGEPPWTF